jgi:hypothetical protein
MKFPPLPIKRGNKRKILQTISLLLGCMLWAAVSACADAQVTTPHGLQLGGNVNEHPEWLVPGVLDQTHTTWVRAFIPASEFISGRRSYKNDSGLQQLRAAAQSGHKIVLSIKWDCADKGKEGIRVPAPDSAQEQTWFKFADNLISAMNGSVSILVVNNELFIDTQPQDLVPGLDGQVPMVRFLQRLVAHISSTHPPGADGKALPLYTGGFTRLDREKTRNQPALRLMIDWINKDPNVSGCDFHLHQPDIATSKDALEFMHKNVPHKPLIVTEFSLVWKWTKHLPDRIDATSNGAAFEKKYNVASGSKVVDFFNAAFQHPVPQAEWQEFLASQPWFEPQYLDEIGPLMQANGVTVATYALTLNPLTSRPRQITEDTPAWFVNNLLVPGLAVSPDPGLFGQNYGFFDSFVRWQSKHGGS